MSYRTLLLCALTCVLVACLTTAAVSQSLPSGDLIGFVTDPSGAAIPNANVKLTNNAAGATQARTTTDQGTYRFSLLSPGTYTLSISASNFQISQQTATVTVGEATTMTVHLHLSSSSQTAEATCDAL